MVKVKLIMLVRLTGRAVVWKSQLPGLSVFVPFALALFRLVHLSGCFAGEQRHQPGKVVRVIEGSSTCAAKSALKAPTGEHWSGRARFFRSAVSWCCQAERN